MAVMVDNAPLRAAFERKRGTERLTPAELAARVGWAKGADRGPDGSRVERVLGLKWTHERGRLVYQRKLAEDNAKLLAAGMHLDPVDCGF